MTGNFLVLLASAGCGPPFASECQRSTWVEVAPDEPTGLGYTAREAADHFTFTEDVIATSRDGSPIAFRVEVVITPRLSSFSEYVLATGLTGSLTCPPGDFDVGDIELHLTASDGSIDELLVGRLRSEQGLAMTTAIAEVEVPAEELTGTWTPETVDSYSGRWVAYFQVVMVGGESGARVEHIEVGGVASCHPKGGCVHTPEITFDAP